MTWGLTDDEAPLARRPSGATLSPTMMMSALSSPPPSPPALPLDMGHAQRSVASSRRLFVIFALILCSCGVGLVSVSTLLQGSDVLRSSAISLNGKAASTQLAAQGQGLRRGGSPISAYTSAAPVVPPASPSDPAPTTSTIKLPVNERWSRLGNLDDYECVAWRPTADCSPLGAVDMNRSSSCSESIVNGVSGYCEIRHKSSKKTHKIMEMYCDSLRPGVSFRCQDFAQVLNYGRRAPQYVHDTGFSFNTCRQSFLEDQKAVNSAPVPIDAATRPDQFFKQGIAIVVYEKLLESVYASIKSLRQQGCSLPIELWYLSSETDTNHPILRTLTRDFGAYLREITDPRASRFYTKTYAVFYSAFDQVLLLDADNFAVRDPTYLFSTKEFVDTGAIFWPDFWRFKKTIFNIQPTSFVWDVFDLDPVDMFEQESGQVLVDRRRHFAAMNVMMYYSFHPQLIESMRLVWGDKDLFRFAWMKTKSSFHMIKMPPGAAGVKLADRNVFCGVTMVQHDTKHEVLFLHRNQEKLTSENKRVVWQDLQQFKINSVPMDEYDVRGANGGRYYPMFKRCYGKDIYYEKAFTVRPVAELPFAGLEARLLDFVTEAGRIINGTASTQ